MDMPPKHSFLALIVLLLLSGCTFTHTIKPEPLAKNLPPVTMSPLHAGIYYSPQFANQEYARVSGDHIWKVRIGAGSIRLFNSALPRVFEKTSLVQTLSAEELRSKGVDVVIAPTLEHFDFRIGIDPDRERYGVSYRITLYSRQGVPFSSWVVAGNAKYESRMWTMTSLIEDDMVDAASRFFREFENTAGPALRALGARSDNEADKIDLRNVIVNAKPAVLPGLKPKLAEILEEAGVLAVQITAQNQAERALVMRASDMRLQLDGLSFEPAMLNDILSTFDRTSHAGILQQQLRQIKRDKLFAEGAAALFEDRTLKKGREETGIVLFRIPKGVKTADTVTLTVWVVDPAAVEGKQIVVAVSLSR